MEESLSSLPPLVLASQSPRRRELLQQSGLAFEVDPPDRSVEEQCGVCSQLSPDQWVARLAFQKATDVAARRPDRLVLGCDTVAECQGWILGKPTDREDAERMLRQMGGRDHRVYSGLCLVHAASNRFWGRVVVSHLRMDPIRDEQLTRYLDSEAWVGKAGAFGFQDGLDWVHLLEGSSSNVVGLPVEALQEMLRDITWELTNR